MILGLALLAANLRGFIEIVVTYLLLFWEKKSTRSLIKKNLVAHKHTNKLTSIIYALTLGCVIFLCVALNLVIEIAQQGSESAQEYEYADIILTSTSQYGFYTGSLDRVLKANQLVIRDFGYIPQKLTEAQSRHIEPRGSPRYVVLQDMAQMHLRYSDVIGLQPSTYFDDAISIGWSSDKTGLAVTDQLYTARGVQGTAGSKEVNERLYIDPDDLKSYLELENYNTGSDFGNRMF